MYIGGEQLVLPILQLVEHYVGSRPLQTYATSEVAPVLALHPDADRDAPEGAVGRLIDGSEIRLMDANGVDVTDGDVGEAWVRGNGAMLGYWREPSITASRVTAQGWYRTGDFPWRDAASYYFMFRRNEDVIVGDGTMVALSDVEAAIAGIVGVEDVVVVAVKDDDFGKALIAFVVITAGHSMSIDAVYDALGSRVARTELPRKLHILSDFPLDVAGKRDRQHLREMAQRRHERQSKVVALAGWRAKHQAVPVLPRAVTASVSCLPE